MATKRIKKRRESDDAKVAVVGDDVDVRDFGSENDSENDVERSGGFLTPEAFREWTMPRDEHNSCQAWFVGSRVLKRIANRLAGGNGEAMESPDWDYKSIVMDGRPAEEVFGREVETVRHQASYIGELDQLYLRCVIWGEDFRRVYGSRLELALKRNAKAGKVLPRDRVIIRVLQDGEDPRAVLEELGVNSTVVADRVKTREVELSEIFEREREFVAYEIVVRGDDPEEVFARRDITRAGVEARLKSRPLTKGELESVVKCDGESVACATCGEAFQPIVTRVVLRDLKGAKLGELDSSYFAGGRKELLTIGSYRNFYNEEGLLEPMAFHGPCLEVGEKYFQGTNCLLEARRIVGSDGKFEEGLERSYGREQAQRLADGENSSVQKEVTIQSRIAELRSRRSPLKGGGGGGGFQLEKRR